MRRCAFVSMQSMEGFVADDDLAIPPLAARGWRVEVVPWDASGVRWDDFELVVLRTPWDYQHRAAEFLEALAQIEQSQARLENPLEVVRENIDKTYLARLESRGVRIVPTLWQQPFDLTSLERAREEFGRSQLVVKPTIGAGAQGTFRISPEVNEQELQKVAAELTARAVMVQPMIESVVEVGEYSLIYFDGDYSHAILKTPKPRDFRVQEEHGAAIRPVTPAADLRAAAEQALAAVGTRLLYARVDLVRLPDGEPAIMELELIEPALYLRYDAGSAERFAGAIVRRMG